MQPTFTGESIRTIIQFLIVGIVCFTYNKPIAKELARIYLLPIKWLFGEKLWLIKMHYVFTLWMRFTLYGGVLISLMIIISEIGYIFNFF